MRGKQDIHSNYHHRLKEKRQCRISTRNSAVEESNAGDDKPDNESAKDDVGVIVLESDILRVDIDLEGVPSVGGGGVVLRLFVG